MSERMEWLRTRRRIDDLRALPRGWDSYDGRPVEPKALRVATDLARLMERCGFPAPTSVTLTSGGDVALEWQDGDDELTFETSATGDEDAGGRWSAALQGDGAEPKPNAG